MMSDGRSETPCARPVASAERARNHGRGGDGEPDVDRHDEERHQADVTDGGLERLIAELRHPEQRQKIDDEHRHQADGAGRGHHRDVAHQRAMRELGPLVVGGAGGVQDSFLLARAAVLKAEAEAEARARAMRPPSRQMAFAKSGQVFRLTARSPASYLATVLSPLSGGKGEETCAFVILPSRRRFRSRRSCPRRRTRSPSRPRR